MSYIKDLSKILEVPKDRLDSLDEEMNQAGYGFAIDKTEKENDQLIERSLKKMDLSNGSINFDSVYEGLNQKVKKHEQELYKQVGVTEEDFGSEDKSIKAFERVAESARQIVTQSSGFFLKKKYAEKILKERPPEKTMESLGYKSVDEMLSKEDVGEVISALRFTESNDWMHETFKVAYSNFKPSDFEERDVELRVLGNQWKEVAKKYVAKKHHNVSHLKEFGIIFVNPIAQVGTGKFLRDFALILHYFHEISFYSKLFKRHSESEGFNDKFISLLRGDVLEKKEVDKGEWLIVQRYLWKENPEDPRLFIPRINPEALYWRRAQQDLVNFSKKESNIDLDFWDDLDFVGGVFSNDLVSFEMEDNAMSTVARHEGTGEKFFYHQREALWNRIFANYVGGYENLEKFALDNIDKGSVKF